MGKDLSEVKQFFRDRQSIGIKPGLERMHHLLQLVGNPEKQIKSIHVAGTNGKGSTVQFLKHALRENMYNVGVFMSPSLTGLLGHMSKNEAFISKAEFLQIFNTIYPLIQQMDDEQENPTEFEILTVIALLYFAKGTDIVLIEAGMGGRFDTTNVIHPLLTIITNVALDHTAFLGEDITKIAFHKAGIIKERIPVIVGSVDKVVHEIIKKEACQKQAEMYVFNKHFTYENSILQPVGQSFFWKSEKDFSIHLQLEGKHQAHNASLSIMALLFLEKIGFSMDWQKCFHGLKKTTLCGRLETVHTQPKIILDGAHNPASIQAFVETVSSRSSKKRQLIFAAFNDKDITEMLMELKKVFPTPICTTFEHHRAATFHAFKDEEVIFQANWKALLDETIVKNSDTEYYVTGSLHFISLVRKYITERNK